MHQENEFFPSNCPPSCAQEMELILYRIFISDKLELINFKCYAFYNDYPRYRDICEAYAISFYKDKKRALKAKRDRLKRTKVDNIGEYIAAIKLEKKDGRVTFVDSHVRVWFYKDFNPNQLKLVSNIKKIDV